MRLRPARVPRASTGVKTTIEHRHWPVLGHSGRGSSWFRSANNAPGRWATWNGLAPATRSVRLWLPSETRTEDGSRACLCAGVVTAACIHPILGRLPTRRYSTKVLFRRSLHAPLDAVSALWRARWEWHAKRVRSLDEDDLGQAYRSAVSASLPSLQRLQCSEELTSGCQALNDRNAARSRRALRHFRCLQSLETV